MERSPAADGRNPKSVRDISCPPRGISRRQIVPGAVVVAVVVASNLVLGPSSAWQEAVLDQDRTFLDVPLASLFTAPALPSETVNTSARLSYSSGLQLASGTVVPESSVLYQWSVLPGTGLLVKVLLGSSWPSDPASPLEAGANAFVYSPAAPPPSHSSSRPASYLNGTLEGPGLQGVFLTRWAMDCTVRKMGILQGLTPSSHLEVGYTLSVLSPGSVRPFSSTTATAPSTTDLVTSSGPASASPGVSLALDGNSHSIDRRAPCANYQPLDYNETPVTLNAGSAGALRVRFESMSEWDASCANMNESWPITA